MSEPVNGYGDTAEQIAQRRRDLLAALHVEYDVGDAPCGTMTAVRRHRRDGLRRADMDQACRQAERDYARRDWQRRKLQGFGHRRG